VSVAVLVLEGQLIVTLTVLLVAATVARVVVAGVVVAGVVVARIVVAWVVVAGIVVAGVSTITATVIAGPTAQEVTKTKESDPDLVLPGSLASPSPATVTASSSSSEEAKQTSVSIVSLGLSLPPATGIVIAATVESPAENSATEQPGSYAQETPVNQLIARADEPCVRVCLLSSRVTGRGARRPPELQL